MSQVLLLWLQRWFGFVLPLTETEVVVADQFLGFVPAASGYL